MKSLDCLSSAISDKTCPPKGLLPIPKKSRTIKTDKPRPYLCPICTRGFSRQEHLKRHQRSHTNEKPFLCALCGRCFARRDLVLRHQQKLCAALNCQEKRQQLVGRHIIQRPGNKEIVLPTPQNPMAPHVLPVEIKGEGAAGKRSLSAGAGDVPKVKVRESFSVPTILTYLPERDDRNSVKNEFADAPPQVAAPSARKALRGATVHASEYSDVAPLSTSLSVLPYYNKSCDCIGCPGSSCGQAYGNVISSAYGGQATTQFPLNECFVNSGSYSPPKSDVLQPMNYAPQPNPYYFSYKTPDFHIERAESIVPIDSVGQIGPVDAVEPTLPRNNDNHITQVTSSLYIPVKQLENQKPMEYWGSYNLPLASAPSCTFASVVSPETSVAVSNQCFVNNAVPIYQNIPQAPHAPADAPGPAATLSTDFFTLSEKHDFDSFENSSDEQPSGVLSGAKKIRRISPVLFYTTAS